MFQDYILEIGHVIGCVIQTMGGHRKLRNKRIKTNKTCTRCEMKPR